MIWFLLYVVLGSMTAYFMASIYRAFCGEYTPGNVLFVILTWPWAWWIFIKDTVQARYQ